MTDISLPATRSHQRPIVAAAGILACNEEEAIGPMIESLFHQSYFEKIEGLKAKFQIFIVANGCTDGTAETARRILEEKSRDHARRNGRLSICLSAENSMHGTNSCIEHPPAKPSSSS